jgi:hypothetical protein
MNISEDTHHFGWGKHVRWNFFVLATAEERYEQKA